MRAAVAAAYRSFTTQFEGSLSFMYLDALGLVTTGIGNLIDPESAAAGLPWLHADGTRASSADISAEWNTIKNLQDMKSYGGGTFRSYTSLHLDAAGLDALFNSKSAANEATLRKAFPKWDSFPADAQLGILSMAWAMGAGFTASFPHFTAAANAGDWQTAAAECQMAPTPGIAPRNAANLHLFQNAAAGGNPATLYYPGSPGAATGKGPALVALLLIGAYGAYRIWGRA